MNRWGCHIPASRLREPRVRKDNHPRDGGAMQRPPDGVWRPCFIWTLRKGRVGERSSASYSMHMHHHGQQTEHPPTRQFGSFVTPRNSAAESAYWRLSFVPAASEVFWLAHSSMFAAKGWNMSWISTVVLVLPGHCQNIKAWDHASPLCSLGLTGPSNTR